MAYVAVFAAILCATLRCARGGYIFSALTTLFCALAVCASRTPLSKASLIAGLLISIAADWFLAHRTSGDNRFLYGLMGFFAAHCLFGWYAYARFSFHVPALIAAGVLLLAYGIYLVLRVLPRLDAALKIPVVMYAVVSIVSFYFAMTMSASALEKVLYIAGIAAILFSDSMIAEADFLGNHRAGPLILPTYYLCHILISLSAIIRS